MRKQTLSKDNQVVSTHTYIGHAVNIVLSRNEYDTDSTWHLAMVSGLTGKDWDWGEPENQGPFTMTQHN